MSQSTYLANLLNDHVLRGVVYTPPADIHIALFTSSYGLDDNILGIQTEVSGGSYARFSVDNTTFHFTPSLSKTSANLEDWLFPICTVDWGIITHAAIMDASTLGNVLYWGPLGVATLIEVNDIFRFLAGELESIYG